MPLYDYACTRCGRVHEVRHGFDETYDTPCEACGGPVRRVFSAAPVLFKGSGFYVTDSRRSTQSKPEKAPDKPEKPKAEPPATDGASSGSKPDAPAKSEAKASEPAA